MSDKRYKYITQPPDGGWGYACIIGMLIIMMLFGLSVRAFGIIYVMLLERFQTSATIASAVGAANILAWGFFGPVSSWISMRFGCRVCAAVGSVLQCLGFILTSFSTSVYPVFVTFGVFVGVGMSMCTTSGYLIIGQYFDKRRALMTSVGSSGGALGLLVFPTLLEYISETYSFSGSMILLGGFCLQGLVSAALFRPVPTIRVPIEEMEVSLETKETCEEDDIQTEEETWFTLLKNPSVIGVMLVNFGSAMVSSAYSAFQPVLLMENGISRFLSYFAITVSGISDAVGKISIGYMMDRPTMRPYFLYPYLLFSGISACACAAFPLVPHYAYYTIMNIGINVFLGIVFAQRTTAFLHIVKDAKRMPALFGVVQAVNSTGLTGCRVLGGILRDATGHYEYIFYLSGGIGVLCSLIFFIILMRK